MNEKETGSRARKKRLHSKRADAGLAQISAWVPVDRRSYAREVLKAVASGSNSLPPDPEMVAELENMRSKIEAAELQIKTLEAERDAAKESEAKRIAEAKQIVQDARNLAKTASGRAKNAENTIKRVKSLPGIKGRLVRWLAGEVLPD